MAVLGIELGSTRIKAVLIDGCGAVLGSGAHDWENRFEDGIWTYHLDDVWAGLADAVAQVLPAAPAERIESLGVSAMMHGYLAFDGENNLLAPFRTWRNTSTARAAAELTELFGFNIPQRWSVAHLYQAILNGEPHVEKIAYLTTLAGYVHWRLTGEKVLGIGDASGMFPLTDGAYDPLMVEKFKALTGMDWNAAAPRILRAGESAGALKEPFCGIPAGTPVCPPEGDAGTGMVATDSVAPLLGNVSAGTSIFAMAVLEKPLKGVYPEIDMVTTPTGSPVAMVHCNNCTSDLDAWFGLFGELLRLSGAEMKKAALYDLLYGQALNAQPGAGGLLSYNYYSGEHITGLETGVPLFLRRPDSALSLGNFCQNLLFSSVATLKLGMDILTGKEGVHLTSLRGHGGLFKTKLVGQRVLASALGVPVTVSATAGEGGPWGMALLALYMLEKGDGLSLETFLAERIFAGAVEETVGPDPGMAESFAQFMDRYERGLPVERMAAEWITPL